MPNEEPVKSKSFLSISVPVATVFISSFCLMVLEMVAGRLIARYLGSSLYTWTAVIEVVLAGITIGYYIGGRIADKFDTQKALPVLFIAGSIACVLIIVFGNAIREWLFLWQFGWPVRVFSTMAIMFLLPCTVLGAITPVVAKNALEKGLPKGRTVGDIYAWGAAGSIAGTLAAGYYLIPAMGTMTLIWLVAGIMAILAIICRLRFQPAYLWLAVFAFLLITAAAPMQWCMTLGVGLMLREPIDENVIYQDESQYCYIAVKQLSAFPDRRIFVQDTLKHSELIMGDINDLQYEYTIVYAKITRLMSQNRNNLNVMFIGGGGYVLPRYIQANWPGSRIDVVEIDPAVTRAAIEEFGLEKDTPINTFTMDARNYVDKLLEDRRNGKPIPKYDFIYEDAFNDYSVPYQLVTREFNDKIAEILSDDGAYIMNLIDTHESAQFLGAVINTLQKTFPYVYVTAEQNAHPVIRETFVVAAAKKPIDIMALQDDKKIKIWHPTEAEMEHFRKSSHGIVLTDDYTPVENLLTPVVNRSARKTLGRRYLDDAKMLKAEGKLDQSIVAFENASEFSPILAFNEIALIKAAQNKPLEAIKAFQKAIDSYDPNIIKERLRGPIYLSMGILLKQMGREEESRKHLAMAIEEFHLDLANDPNSALTWSRLGDTFGMIGDLNEASNAFEKAISLEPGNMAHRYSLAQVFEFQDRLTDAIAVVQKAIELASISSDSDATADLKEYLSSLERKQAAKAPK
ncbi:MAG: fused MFS/spermidine synthase [Sedimentisphaerales bacterium]|jgi:tetratricopeptide (TPR) repeat protein